MNHLKLFYENMEISRNQCHYFPSILYIKNRAKCIKCSKEGLFHVIALLDLLVENKLQNSMLIIQKNVSKTRVNTINYVFIPTTITSLPNA